MSKKLQKLQNEMLKRHLKYVLFMLWVLGHKVYNWYLLNSNMGGAFVTVTIFVTLFVTVKILIISII